MVLAMLTITAPLAFAMGSSKSTSDVFLWMVLIISIVKVAKKADEIINKRTSQRVKLPEGVFDMTTAIHRIYE